MRMKDYFPFLFSTSFFTSLTPHSLALWAHFSWCVLFLSQCTDFSSVFHLPHHAPLFVPHPSSSLSNMSTTPAALSRVVAPIAPTPFPLCLVKVESLVWMPRRRPLSFCPCCSPEGNVTELPLLPVRRVTMAAQRSLECRLLPRWLPLCFLTLSSSFSPCLCVIRLSWFPPERFPNTT